MRANLTKLPERSEGEQLMKQSGQNKRAGRNGKK